MTAIAYGAFFGPIRDSLSIPMCQEGSDNIDTQTSQEGYDQENPAWWFFALYYLNRAKSDELTLVLMQRLLDEGAVAPGGTDPVGDPQGFLDWHAANCGDRRRAESCHVAFAYGARLVLDNFEGIEHQFLEQAFISAWAISMGAASGDSSGSWLDSLSSAGGDWFRGQCSYEEFCNGQVVP